jgi:pimeloyl-ACP methyl ester carboxylesterase
MKRHEDGTETGNSNELDRAARSPIQKARRIMGIILTILAAIIVVFASLLLLWSPGKIRPVLDANGSPLPNSISEKTFVTINGVEQGMFIRSADTTHPVLLFLHGGPAMPTYVLEQKYPTGLEKDFTIVWWEQRGAGLSYSSDIPPETMTVKQMVADTVAATDYLRKRFGKEKIYLMGHSWGSFIGIQAAAQAPERYHAYIGVGQLTNQLESERLAYAYMLNAYRAQGNADMVRKLETAKFEMTVPLPESYIGAARRSHAHFRRRHHA